MTPHLADLLSDLLSGSEEELPPLLGRKLDELGGAEALDAPVLICGCGHSGTTLMLSILGAHSELQAIPFESSFARRPPVSAADFRMFFDVLCLYHERKRWVEKTPMHVHFLGPILKAYPMHRSSCVCAMDAMWPVPFGIGTMILEWAWLVGCGTIELRSRFGTILGSMWCGMNRWSRISKDASTPSFVLGIDWEPGLIDYHQRTAEYYGGVARQDLMSVLRMMQQTRPRKRGPNQHHSPNNFEHRYWQMSQPVFDGRGIWKTQMSERERQIFKAAAGETLIKYGYVHHMSW